MVGERVSHLVRGHLQEWPVAWAGAGDQDMVDLTGNGVEESRQRTGAGRVKRGGASRVDVECRSPEALRVAACQDHISAVGACPSSGLEADAGAAANQNDGLPEQLG